METEVSEAEELLLAAEDLARVQTRTEAGDNDGGGTGRSDTNT